MISLEAFFTLVGQMGASPRWDFEHRRILYSERGTKEKLIGYIDYSHIPHQAVILEEVKSEYNTL